MVNRESRLAAGSGRKAMRLASWFYWAGGEFLFSPNRPGKRNKGLVKIPWVFRPFCVTFAAVCGVLRRSCVALAAVLRRLAAQLRRFAALCGKKGSRSIGHCLGLKVLPGLTLLTTRTYKPR